MSAVMLVRVLYIQQLLVYYTGSYQLVSDSHNYWHNIINFTESRLTLTPSGVARVCSGADIAITYHM